jgi:hypothetical protein
MFCLKLDTRPRTPIVSPKFVSMASKDAAKVSMEQRETSVEEPELWWVSRWYPRQRSLWSNSETASDNYECVKIGAVTAPASVSYDFG